MELNLKDTELRLGLPGRDIIDEGGSCSVIRSKKRSSREEEESISKSNNVSNFKASEDEKEQEQEQDNNTSSTTPPPAKVQVVGWPPIRSYRKNVKVEEKKGRWSSGEIEGEGSGMYVKVSMDGAPYLRKIDLKVYNSYPQLLNALQIMFNCTFGEYSEREGYNGSEHAPTYEDKDGDWMLVGDVPWNMFMSSCKRLRIMKGSEAKGLGCL